MEKGIVKKVEQGKQWESKYGPMVNWYVEIEQDGVLLKGGLNKKPGNTPKFIVGQEATFTKKDNHNTNMFDFKWDDGVPYNASGGAANTNYKPDQKSGNSQLASFALSYAKDTMGNFSQGNLPGEADFKQYIEDVKYVADEYLKWLKENG